MKEAWTKEYCGLQHLGKLGTGKLRVSVERHTHCATLLEWYLGCGFHPKETDYPTVEEAKQVGEAIMQG